MSRDPINSHSDYSGGGTGIWNQIIAAATTMNTSMTTRKRRARGCLSIHRSNGPYLTLPSLNPQNPGSSCFSNSESVKGHLSHSDSRGARGVTGRSVRQNGHVAE
jgi:hypothetical protein